jgi:hypothetical protein
MPENKKVRYTFKNIMAIIVIIIAGVVAYGIYDSHETWLKEMSEINSNTGYGKGIVLRIWGGGRNSRTIKIRYKINDKVFEAVNDWDRNPQDLVEGDSICVKYSIKHPQYVVTELEFEYRYPKLNRFSIF